jgi:2'-5' RNA ligase
MAESQSQRPTLQRLFLALWPDEAIRRRLVECFPLLRGCGGRKVPLENLHITLAFLGSVDADTRACLEQQLDVVTASSFTLEMDELGFWRRPQVVWLGASQVPPALSALVNEVKKAMLVCSLEPESRPFQAHLTLMRKAKRMPLETNPPPMLWRINDFALIASETLPEGAHYEVLRRWRLNGYY